MTPTTEELVAKLPEGMTIETLTASAACVKGDSDIFQLADPDAFESALLLCLIENPSGPLGQVLSCYTPAITKALIIEALDVQTPEAETTRFCLGMTDNFTVNPDDGFVETMSVQGEAAVDIPVAWNGWTQAEKATWVADQGADTVAEGDFVYAESSFGIAVRGGSFSDGVGQLFRYIRLAAPTVISGKDCTEALTCFNALFGCSLIEMITATEYGDDEQVVELTADDVAEAIASKDEGVEPPTLPVVAVKSKLVKEVEDGGGR